MFVKRLYGIWLIDRESLGVHTACPRNSISTASKDNVDKIVHKVFCNYRMLFFTSMVVCMFYRI